MLFSNEFTQTQLADSILISSISIILLIFSLILYGILIKESIILSNLKDAFCILFLFFSGCSFIITANLLFQQTIDPTLVNTTNSNISSFQSQVQIINNRFTTVQQSLVQNLSSLQTQQNTLISGQTNTVSSPTWSQLINIVNNKLNNDLLGFTTITTNYTTNLNIWFQQILAAYYVNNAFNTSINNLSNYQLAFLNLLMQDVYNQFSSEESLGNYNSQIFNPTSNTTSTSILDLPGLSLNITNTTNLSVFVNTNQTGFKIPTFSYEQNAYFPASYNILLQYSWSPTNSIWTANNWSNINIASTNNSFSLPNVYSSASLVTRVFLLSPQNGLAMTFNGAIPQIAYFFQNNTSTFTLQQWTWKNGFWNFTGQQNQLQPNNIVVIDNFAIFLNQYFWSLMVNNLYTNQYDILLKSGQTNFYNIVYQNTTNTNWQEISVNSNNSTYMTNFNTLQDVLNNF